MSRPPVTIDQRRKPVAGYPTQVAAIGALADDGHGPDEIGRRVGRDANHVRAILRRIRGVERPRKFALPLRLSRGLESEALMRGLTPVDLATALLDVVIRDELFDALLGEPGDAHG